MDYLPIVVFWIACGFVAAMIASSKGGNGALGFLVGLLLGPFGIVIALFMGNDVDKVEALVASGKAKKCPMCAEAVLPDAVICKHCGHDFYAEFKDADPLEDEELMRNVRDFELEHNVKLFAK